MKKFAIPFKDTEIKGDRTLPEKECSILMMHGAGGSNRDRFDNFRLKLAGEGITTVAFDFIGHGETGGELIGSSLKERTEQAKAVIKDQNLKEPLTLIGYSMSGYTAIKLTEDYEVETLILNVPAVYREDAYNAPFGDEFAGKIREERSWLDSDAWQILENYMGALLSIVSEFDTSVPREITDKIFESAKNTSKKEQVIIKNAPHRILLHAKEHQEVFDEIYSAMKRFL